MTRDAVLLTAQQTAEKVDALVRDALAEGVAVGPEFYVERRLQALVDMLLPDEDDRARLELAYQESLHRALEAALPDAISAARQQRLLPSSTAPQLVKG